MTSPYTRTTTVEPPASPHPAPTYAPQYNAPYAPSAYVQPQYQQHYQQQPVIVRSAAGSSKLETVILGMLALLAAVVAGVGGYFLSVSTAPSQGEMQAYQSIAQREGAFAGRNEGFGLGRQQAIAERQNVVRLQGLIAKQRAFNRGHRAGVKNGRQWYSGYGRNRGYYGGGYSGRRNYGYGSYYGGGVSAALSQAQGIANATGQSVDVEIY